jgi:hypothetical protein
MLNLIKPKNHSHIQWQDAVKTLILLAMAIYFAALIFTGNLSNYINLRFAWLAYIGAGGFLLLGLWSVRGLLQPHSHADHHAHHDHQHLPLSWTALGIVSIPLLIAIFIPSQPLGLEAVSGGISLQPISGVRLVGSVLPHHSMSRRKIAMCWIGYALSMPHRIQPNWMACP